MAKIKDLLKDKKSLIQLKQLVNYANKNNFEWGWVNQSSDKRPRIIINIYPEGRPRSFGRYEHAYWIFYLNPDDVSDNGGGYSEPEVLRLGGKSYTNFKRFIGAIEKRYRGF